MTSRDLFFTGELVTYSSAHYGADHDALFGSMSERVDRLTEVAARHMSARVLAAELPGLTATSISEFCKEYFKKLAAIMKCEIRMFFANFFTNNLPVNNLNAFLLVFYCERKAREIVFVFNNILENFVNYVEKIYMKHYEIVKSISRQLINQLETDVGNGPYLRAKLQTIGNNLAEVVNSREIVRTKLQVLGVTRSRLQRIDDFLFGDNNYIGVMYSGLQEDIVRQLNVANVETPNLSVSTV